MLAEAKYYNLERISLYLDVGANAGQTGQFLRKVGYTARIASFEPVADTYAALAAEADADPLWDTYRMALGDSDGTASIAVTQDRVSSSLLKSRDFFKRLHPGGEVARHEDVPLARLDTILPGIARPDDAIFLKIDAQGYERTILAGTTDWLPRIRAVRLEVAVTGVYEGEWTIAPAITWMRKQGYVLAEAQPAWRHPRQKRAMYFDLVFLNRQRDDGAAD